MRALAAAPPVGAVIVARAAMDTGRLRRRGHRGRRMRRRRRSRAFRRGGARQPACRSTSSTGRRSAILLSARSSIARRSSSAFRPTAPRRSSARRSAPKIEALIPKGFARWADAARLGARACKRWRSRSAAGAISGRNSPTAPSPRPIRSPTEADLDALLEPRPLAASRLRCARRRRPRRSGTADAARGARAAIGRRDPVRQSGVGGRFSISRGAKPRKCWSARPATRRLAVRTTSTR